ncbi:uncharacterized protein BKA55DRAFT_690596 [Fusarium redolens]|uniref:Uncharacterized protein n=1 Tax=Fusarium redolens TaxID=48865 RepID=A0A9P9KEW3_FUSRE|nr:uncharacterized protein BKA55DRAFT_690596 [Fusarium redolens]KAH7250364.1 hypothetical protein BKA55DRAFT_690596 [Fusarium redolens]
MHTLQIRRYHGGWTPNQKTEIGGFGSSISLVSFLKEKLKVYSRQHNCHVKLLQPDDRSTIPSSVSSGAVYRACNKANGPERIAQCSYGILGREPHMPDEYPEHRGQKYTRDPYDGDKYIPDIMTWILKKGKKVAPFLTVHTVGLLQTGPLSCRQELFISDRATDDHYPITHWKKKGAQKVGVIEVDVSFLRDQNLLTPKEARVENGIKIGKDHYEIPLTIRMTVIGRDLECRAIYKDVYEKKCRLNIASAFKPGVE